MLPGVRLHTPADLTSRLPAARASAASLVSGSQHRRKISLLKERPFSSSWTMKPEPQQRTVTVQAGIAGRSRHWFNLNWTCLLKIAKKYRRMSSLPHYEGVRRRLIVFLFPRFVHSHGVKVGWNVPEKFLIFYKAIQEKQLKMVISVLTLKKWQGLLHFSDFLCLKKKTLQWWVWIPEHWSLLSAKSHVLFIPVSGTFVGPPALWICWRKLALARDSLLSKSKHLQAHTFAG